MKPIRSSTVHHDQNHPQADLGPRINKVLHEISHEFHAEVWNRLAQQLHRDGAVTETDPQAIKAWLQSTIGLKLELAIRPKYEPMPLPAVHTTGHASAAPAPKARAVAPEIPEDQRPTTTNPLALAVANFKGFRGIPADMKAKTRFLPRGRDR